MVKGARCLSTMFRSDELSVTIDPQRGGAIASIVAEPSGVELFYQPHWSAGPLASAGRDEDAWTRAWRGGWNALFPNAGSACSIDRRRHSFHGAASITPWAVTACECNGVALRWGDGEGLVLERTLELIRDVVRVDSVVRNEGRQARSVRAPMRSSRFGVLHDVLDRTIGIAAIDVGLDIQLTWSPSFPFLWFWEERSPSTPGPLDGATMCLGLEPATTSTADGLAAAIERDEASELEPGAEDHYWVELSVQR
jgi:hypothetical protein